MKFVLKGHMRVGERDKVFTKHVEAKDEAEAREKTLALFGSEHGTKRRWINIESVEKDKE